jgi:hypothetical protein
MTATAEKRQFRINPKILFDIILRQAGTLSKAIIEGVMNSVDAGATECHIEATKSQVTITDNGSGIQERKHIEQWFEEFGSPHDDRERKVFGTFRMGRGQLFAYGVNTWETGPFKMEVDVKNKGLDYHLHEKMKPVDGCRVQVDLYETLKPSEMAETERMMRQWVRYAPLKITWNGEVITVDPEKEKWDHVLPEAYVRLKDTGSISLYNLGIHTMEIASYRFGTGGLIVSRKQLKVNFARNDVLDSCPVWRKIKPFVARKADEKMAKKTVFNASERQRLADQIMAGDVDPRTSRDLKIFTNVSGQQVSFNQIAGYRFQKKVSCCKPGDPLGDTLHQHRVAFILSEETLERFGFEELDDMVEFMNNRFVAPGGWRLEPVNFEDLSEGFSRDFNIVDSKKLTVRLKMWLDLMHRCKYYIKLSTETSRYWTYGVDMDSRACSRKIVIGTGPAHGWTNGIDYVAVEKGFLGGLDFNVQGFVKLGNLMLHEFCHSEPTTASHIHSSEFYQIYHDSSDTVAEFVKHCIANMPKVYKKFNKKPNQKILLANDRLADAADVETKTAKS